MSPTCHLGTQGSFQFCCPTLSQLLPLQPIQPAVISRSYFSNPSLLLRRTGFKRSQLVSHFANGVTRHFGAPNRESSLLQWIGFVHQCTRCSCVHHGNERYSCMLRQSYSLESLLQQAATTAADGPMHGIVCCSATILAYSYCSSSFGCS
jgi:hypothetical protein